MMITKDTKRRHQVQVLRKEAEIISLALFWYMQYINYKDIVTCKELYDKYTRIYQILEFYHKLDDDNTKSNIG